MSYFLFLGSQISVELTFLRRIYVKILWNPGSPGTLPGQFGGTWSVDQLPGLKSTVAGLRRESFNFSCFSLPKFTVPTFYT